MTHNQITYGQLDKILRQLGFVCQFIEPHWKRYEHAASDTVILLGDRKPNEVALQSEVVSARIHLIQKGLIGEKKLEEMLFAKPGTPKSSVGKKGKR
jgi:hypothetical protein